MEFVTHKEDREKGICPLSRAREDVLLARVIHSRNSLKVIIAWRKINFTFSIHDHGIPPRCNVSFFFFYYYINLFMLVGAVFRPLSHLAKVKLDLHNVCLRRMRVKKQKSHLFHTLLRSEPHYELPTK